MSVIRYQTIFQGLTSGGLGRLQRLVLPRGVLSESAMVTLAGTDGVIEVDTTLSFRARGREQGRILSLDQELCPLHLRTYESDGRLFGPRHKSQQESRESIRSLALERGQSWGDHRLTLSYMWSKRTRDDARLSPPMLIFPHNLPATIWDGSPEVDEEGSDQPRVLLEDRTEGQVELIGIRYDPEKADGSLLQGVVIPEGVLDDANSIDGVRCSRAFVKGRSVGHVQQAIEHVRRMVEWFTGFTGVAFGRDVVVVAGADTVGQRAWPWGIAFLAKLENLGLGPTESPRLGNIAHQCAGIWWGAGCHVVGRGGKEVEDGLRAAMVLLLAAWSDVPLNLTALLKQYERLAGQGRVVDWRQRVMGYPGGRETSRLALHVYQRCAEDPGLLRRVTRRWWAKRVPARTLLTDLGIIKMTR